MLRQLRGSDLEQSLWRVVRELDALDARVLVKRKGLLYALSCYVKFIQEYARWVYPFAHTTHLHCSAQLEGPQHVAANTSARQTTRCVGVTRAQHRAARPHTTELLPPRVIFAAV